MGAKDIIEVLLSDVGTVAILVLILISGARQYWVWGWTYEKERKDKQEWRRIALSTGKVADRAVSHLSRRDEDEDPPFQDYREETW